MRWLFELKTHIFVLLDLVLIGLTWVVIALISWSFFNIVVLISL